MNEDATVESIIIALEVSGELVLPLQGASMGRRWLRTNRIRVVSATVRAPRWGDVVLFARHGRLYAHRLVLQVGDRCWTKGDARWVCDLPVPRRDDLVGVVVGLIGPSGELRMPRMRILAGLCHLLRALAARPFFPHRGAP